MAKKPSITTVASGYQSTTTINNNTQNLRDAFDNTLSLDGSTPNAMQADLDMNSNDIINAARLYTDGLYIGNQPVSPGNIDYNGVIKETKIATSGQTVFNLTDITYTPNINNLSVFVNGVYKNSTYYTENSPSQVTFFTGLTTGQVVDFVVLSVDTLSSTADAVNLTYTPSAQSLYGTSTITLKSALDQVSNVETGSAKVGFLQSGTSAVSRTVQAKLRDFISVKDFGATGDGSTNDTVAIKAALAALPNGRTLFFPSGTYIVTAGEIIISGKANISLIGEGTGTEDSGVSFRVSGVGDVTKDLIEIVASNGITFSNIGFIGNATNNPANKSRIGVYIHRGAGYTSNINFYRCSFRYFTVGSQVGGLGGNESNNENMRYYACYFNSNTTAYRQYWPNALQNVHEDCYYTNNDYNIWMSDATVQTGSLIVRNANFAVTGVADVYFQLPAKLQIISFRAETTPQLVKSGTFQSTAFPGFLLMGGVIVNQTDDTLPIIDCKVSGFTAIDCRFGEVNEGKFWFNLPLYRQLGTFVGCSFNAATSYGLNSTPGTYTFGGNDGYGQYVISGCMEYNATDNVYVPLPDAFYKYTAFASASGATPSIKTRVCGLCPYLILTNTTAITVTNFLDGYEGAEITVYIGANTTVQHSAAIVFKTATNKTTGAYKFLRYENAWYEI